MIYFDTSLLIPLFLSEPTSASAERFLAAQPPDRLATSQLTRIEFSSVVARAVRMGRLRPADARRVDHEFDSAIVGAFAIWPAAVADFELARTFLQRFETGLRAPDALHLAIAANRRAASFYTLDAGMQKAGRMLGLPVRSGIRAN